MSEVIQPLLDMASDPNNKQHSIAGMLYKTNQLKEEPLELIFHIPSLDSFKSIISVKQQCDLQIEEKKIMYV